MSNVGNAIDEARSRPTIRSSLRQLAPKGPPGGLKTDIANSTPHYLSSRARSEAVPARPEVHHLVHGIVDTPSNDIARQVPNLVHESLSAPVPVPVPEAAGENVVTDENAYHDSPGKLAADYVVMMPKFKDASAAAISCMSQERREETDRKMRREQLQRKRTSHLRYLDTAWQGSEWLPTDIRQKRRYQNKELALHTLSNIVTITKYAIRLGYPLPNLWQPGGLLRSALGPDGVQLRRATSQALATIKAAIVEVEPNNNKEEDEDDNDGLFGHSREPSADDIKSDMSERAEPNKPHETTVAKTQTPRPSEDDSGLPADHGMRRRESATEERHTFSRQFELDTIIEASNEGTILAAEEHPSSPVVEEEEQEADSVELGRRATADQRKSLRGDLAENSSLLVDDFDAVSTPAHRRYPSLTSSRDIIEDVASLPATHAKHDTCAITEPAMDDVIDHDRDVEGDASVSLDACADIGFQRTSQLGVFGSEEQQDGSFQFSRVRTLHPNIAQRSNGKRPLPEDGPTECCSRHAELARKVHDQLHLDGQRMTDDVVWLVSQVLWFERSLLVPRSIRDHELLMDPQWFRAENGPEPRISRRALQPGRTLYVPLHFPQVPEHWALLIIRIASTASDQGNSLGLRLELRDSASATKQQVERVRLIERRLGELMQNDHRHVTIQTTAVSTPQQSDEWSCGRHMLANLHRVFLNDKVAPHAPTPDASSARLGKHLLGVLLATDTADSDLPRAIAKPLQLLQANSTAAMHNKRTSREMNVRDTSSVPLGQVKRRMLEALDVESLSRRIASVAEMKNKAYSASTAARATVAAASQKLSDARIALDRFEENQKSLDEQLSAVQAHVHQGITAPVRDGSNAEHEHQDIHELKSILDRACKGLFLDFNDRRRTKQAQLQAAVEQARSYLSELENKDESHLMTLRDLESKEKGLLKLRDIGNQLRDLDGAGDGIETLLQIEE